MRPQHFVLAAVAAFSLTSCISNVTSRPYTGTEHGVHYWLPKTFLLVTPQADGTVTYQWLYLPNRNREYVVEQSSFLAAFTFDIQVNNGLLKSIGAKEDSTALAAKFATDAGSVATAYTQAAQAAAQKQAQSQKPGGKVAAGDILGGNAVPAPVPSLAYGPVLLQVVQNPDTYGVQLVPVNFPDNQAQDQFLTNIAVQTAAPNPAGAVKLTCTTATASTATVTAPQVIYAPSGPAKVTVRNGDAPVTVTVGSQFAPSGDMKTETITLTFSPPLPSGTYTVTIPYNPKRGGTAADDTSADATCKIP